MLWIYIHYSGTYIDSYLPVQIVLENKMQKLKQSEQKTGGATPPNIAERDACFAT